MNDHVTVSIPCWNSAATIRRAVDAVLRQDHQNLTVIVVNDHSDPGHSPWPSLDDVHDPRLIRFDLPSNHGRYFADAVVLAATTTPWFTVHDADDEARPHWISDQLELAQNKKASAVFCAHRVHGVSGNRSVDRPVPFLRRSSVFRHHAHMAGLWSTQFLKDLGGPRPDFRIGYDTMITGVAMATGRCYLHQGILYERHLQRTSLTKAPGTRIGSPARQQAKEWMARTWPGAIKAARSSPAAAGRLLRTGIPAAVTDAVAHHAARLHQQMTYEESSAWATCLNDASLWKTWALNRGTARFLARELETRRPSVVVESGSGSSTLLFSQYADKFGAKVTALESLEEFQHKTRTLLRDHGTGQHTTVHHAPLHTTPDGPWYTQALPDGIDFALVDGPRERDGGRRAALPALLPHLKPGATVILDDTDRAREQSDLAEWKRRYGLPYLAANTSSSRVIIPPVDAAATGGAKIALTVLTGRRPALLDTTLRRLQTCAPGLLRRAHLTVLHNSGDPATADVLAAYADLIDVTWTTSTLLDIGTATSMLARQATLSGRKYWLHLEDDWCALPLTADWLAQAQTILHTRPAVFQVRLRYHGEPTLTRHMVTSRPLRWSAHAGFRLSTDAHYTLNPSLIRTRDAEKIWPAAGEREAQRRAHRAGLRGVAQLMPGVFQHTGDDLSLRRETGCPV